MFRFKKRPQTVRVSNMRWIADLAPMPAVINCYGDLKVPIIPNIHQALYEAASAYGALNMDNWHTCKTTHCRAGWVIALAGRLGRELEAKMRTAHAAAMIYVASDPTMQRIPNFYCRSGASVLDDMRLLAEAEKARNENRNA